MLVEFVSRSKNLAISRSTGEKIPEEKKCSNVHKLASSSPDEISGILPPDLERRR